MSAYDRTVPCENTACYDCMYADINCDQMKQAPPPPGSGSSSGGGGGGTSKPVSSPLPKIPPDRLKVLRADIQRYMKDSPDDWNVPGSFAYQALMVRIGWAIYGPLTFDDILKAAEGPAVAFVVGLIGAALCPESAGAGCLVAIGAVAGAAGTCASDCSNVTSVALSAVAGAIVGAAGGGSGLETGADQPVFWSGIDGNDAGAPAWVGKNGGVTWKPSSPGPQRDDQRVIDRYGQDAALDLLPAIHQLAKEFYESDACDFAVDLIQMGGQAEERFRGLHPEIAEDAVRASGWCYTFDYK